MRTKMKKGIIALCALSMMATLPVAVFSMNTANAATTTAGADGFYMEQGAAVRTASDELGIRFSATITKSYWESLQTTYGVDATYSFYSVVTDGTTPITKNYDGVTPDFSTKDAYSFYSTIVYTTAELEAAGLLEEACELALTAQTYVDVTYTPTEEGAEETTVTLEAYGETGKRSMKAVANAAVLAGETDEDLFKYFMEGNRSESKEGYAFSNVTDGSGMITMSNLPAEVTADNMEVYYGANKIDATYADGTITFSGVTLEDDQTEAYISVFNGTTVYSSKVAKTTKIMQSNVGDLLTLTGSETVYLAEDIDIAKYLNANSLTAWDTTVLFSGTFDGGNHAIKNLTTKSSQGIFFCISGATIKNVAFVDVTLANNSGVLGYNFIENTTSYIDNVFIEVTTAGNGAGRYGAFVERANKSGKVYVNNVVVSMPGTAVKESLFGYQLRTTAYLTNVYTVGIKTTNKYPYTENSSINTIPIVTDCNYYTDLTAFNDASVALPTTFLASCVTTYLNTVQE